jgi:hypothetical protein
MLELQPLPELSPRERGFVKRMISKYRQGEHSPRDLYRSLAIFSAMVLLAHFIEQFVPTFWLPLVIIYPPAVWLFSRYRRFNIFKSCVLSKVAQRLSRHEPLEPAEKRNVA